MNFKSPVVTIATARAAFWAAFWAAAPALLLAEPYPSTYQPLPSVPTLIVNATILTGTGERIDNGSVLLAGGRIGQIGRASCRERVLYTV